MKILIISPYFAPYTGVGALRMTSLAQYLVDKKEQVTIIKIANDCLPPELNQGSACRGLTILEYNDRAKSQKLVEKRLVDLIDSLCTKEHYDCCVVSCGPYYTLRPALHVKKKYGVKLIIDYRDLWLYDPRPHSSIRAMLGKLKERILNGYLEYKAMDICDAFISVSPRSVQSMIKHYPQIKQKAFCIYNGYTYTNILQCQTEHKAFNAESINICFLGKFAYYSIHNAEIFLSAIKELQESFNLNVIHIGQLENIDPILNKIGLPKQYLHQLGPMPYEEAIQTASKISDIFGLIVSYTEGLGTKIYDYIMLNKPLIIIAPPNSEIEELVSDAEYGFVCHNKLDIKNAITKIIEHKHTRLTADLNYIQKFSRDTQNKLFYDIISKICED